MRTQPSKKPFRLALSALLAAVVPLTGLHGEDEKLPAFPGAEGGGKYATGGRGGEVYHVTNLDDSGPGSLRDAVSEPNRTVVFEVGGVIEIEERLVVSPNITLAGQTAPGDGITVYGDGTSFSNADNAICRFMRFRMGLDAPRRVDTVTIAHGHTMIFDHLSVSWGRDENFSVTHEAEDVTIQNSIMGQGLHPHSCGGLIEADGLVSLFRNLYIANHTRNPKVKFENQFINNVVYNWRVAGYILGDSAGMSYANVVGNYFIEGPETRSAPFSRANENFHIFAENNYLDDNRNGVLDGELIGDEVYGPVTWVDEPFDYPEVAEIMAPHDAYKWVVSRAGVYNRRDEVDSFLLGELTSLGTEGIIIEDPYEDPMNGPGEVRGGQAPTDTDRDGIPDYWKQAVGLPMGEKVNNGDRTGDGYTNLEEYINFLAGPHAIGERNGGIDVHLDLHTAGLNAPIEFDVSGAENGTVEILDDGATARFHPDDDFTGRASFTFTGTDTDGDSQGDTVEILVAEAFPY